MELGKDYLLDLIQELSQGEDIKLSDIPDLDLYMDQVTTFIENKLGYLKRNEDDKMLTKTMINNYSKSKILLPSKNKRYNKQHMILLILIYYLKQVLSINDIQALFLPIFKNPNLPKDDAFCLDNLYNIFLNINEEVFESSVEAVHHKRDVIKDGLESCGDKNKSQAELMMTVITLATQAAAQKRLAEKIIDTYFKPASNPKDSK